MKRQAMNGFLRAGLILVGFVLLSRHTSPLPSVVDELLFGLVAGLEFLGIIFTFVDVSKIQQFKRKYMKPTT